MPLPATGDGIEPRAGRVAAAALGAALFLQGPVVAVAPLGMAPLAIGAAVAVAAVHLARHGAGGVPRTALAGALALLCLLGGASLLWTVSPARTLPAAASAAAILLPGVVLVAAAAGPAGRHGRRIENAFLGGLGLGVVLMLVQMALGHSFGELLGSKPLLNHITPKIVSRPGTLFALTVWVAAIILYRRGQAQLAFLVPFGYAALTLFFSHRATAVAMIVALLVYGAATRAPVLTRRVLTGLLVLLFVGAVPIAEGLQRAGFEDAEWLPSSARHRVEIWQFAADRAQERLFTGHGLDASGSIGNAGRESRFQEPGASIIPLHPHSLFLQVWVELGLPGAALGLGVALLMLMAVVRVAAGPLEPYGLAGFTAYWIFAAMSYGAWQAWWLGSAVLAAASLAFACRPVAIGEERP